MNVAYPSPNPRPQILAVDDDEIMRRFLQIILSRCGYDVHTAESVAEAQAILGRLGVDSFSAVVTDYRMADQTGLELLIWLQEFDPGLATIIVTAESERCLVEDSFRGGATDFLNKPLNADTLEAAVEKAIARTEHQRNLLKAKSNVEQVGRTQQRILNFHLGQGPVALNVCFHPMLDAGGDFISRYPLAGNRYLILATDVSGHDISAAYISAYFHGIVRGMMEHTTTVGEIFGFFNRYLIEDWSQRDRFTHGTSVTSIAAAALLVDLNRMTLTVLASGFPLPLCAHPDGHIDALGTNGCPLGWFDDEPLQPTQVPLQPDHEIYVWTDGMEDLAETLGVSVPSLAYALLSAKKRNSRPEWLGQSRDDILLAHLTLGTNAGADSVQTPRPRFAPLLHERYSRSQRGQIDALQKYWRRSLLFALPHLEENKLFDILLAMREAVLNALTHGCADQPDSIATLALSYERESALLRVRVEDPGPGHNYDFTQRAEGGEDCLEKHCGLVLVKYLPDEVRTERGGATLILEFRLPLADPPQRDQRLIA